MKREQVRSDSTERRAAIAVPGPLQSGAVLVATTIVGMVFAAAGAQAAPGDLDPTFSGNGKQTTDFGGYSDGATDVALQSDGKIVAVGCVCGDRADSAVARYKPNGALDPTFSGDGKQTTDFGDADGASGVGIQDDGKIVTAGLGRGSSQTEDFALARYLGG